MVIIYILELENNKYYIGKSKKENVDNRIKQHFDGRGSEWTKIHKPIKSTKVEDCVDEDEDKYVIIYMKKYGIPNVKGGSFCQIQLPEHNILTLNQMIQGSSDMCYHCMKKGHFIKNCPQKKKDNKYDLNIIRKNFIDECKKLDLEIQKRLNFENIFIALINSHQIFDDIGIGMISIKEICDLINEHTNKKIPYQKYNTIYYDTFIDGLLYLIENNLI